MPKGIRARGPAACACVVFAGVHFAATASADDRLALGRQVFLDLSQPKCGICHTLADAGTKGRVGPELDVLQPDFERVRKAVTEGIGPMPANSGLTPEEIEAVAHYVSTMTGASR